MGIIFFPINIILKEINLPPENIMGDFFNLVLKVLKQELNEDNLCDVSRMEARTEEHVAFNAALSVWSTTKATNLNGTLCEGFFPRQCQLYPDRYLSWAHTAHCSSSNRVCAVLRIPPSLLPSDSSSLAGPQSSVCTRSINGIVRKQRGLYILTWMDAWGSFHFGWQGYSVRLFVPRLHSCCVSSSSAPLTSHGG